MFMKPLVLGGIALALIPHTFSQVGFWDLPTCQQNCVISMLDQNDVLGCAWTGYGSPDVACLCSEPNFENGIRDCILQSCAREWNNYDNAYLQVCASTRIPFTITNLGSGIAYTWPTWRTPISVAPQSVTMETVTVAASTTYSTETLATTLTATMSSDSAAPTSTTTVVVVETMPPAPTS